jgi:glycosyltransferase involved in cell wall biosynthesis
MNSDQPLAPTVSIGLPVFNGANYVADSIQSILSQTFTDLELVISDNASTDDTRAICERFAANDPRVRYHRSNANMGAAWNHNQVFRLSRGRYFRWSSHDDVYAPEYVARCVEILEANPDVVLAYPRVRLLDENGKLLHRLPYPAVAAEPDVAGRFASVLRQTGCYAIYGVIRSESVRRTGLFKPWAAADKNILARLALMGRFYQVEEDLLYFRSHPGRSVKANPDLIGQTVWFNPAVRGKIVFPRYSILSDYVAAIRDSPLQTGERIRCLGQLAFRFRWLGLLRDVTAAAWMLAGRHHPSTKPNPSAAAVGR